jgi:hypothetical protein
MVFILSIDIYRMDELKSRWQAGQAEGRLRYASTPLGLLLARGVLIDVVFAEAKMFFIHELDSTPCRGTGRGEMA